MIDYKYFVKWKLGAGGSSDVYLVNDENNLKYAVKIMRKPNNSLDGWHKFNNYDINLNISI